MPERRYSSRDDVISRSFTQHYSTLKKKKGGYCDRNFDWLLMLEPLIYMLAMLASQSKIL